MLSTISIAFDFPAAIVTPQPRWRLFYVLKLIRVSLYDSNSYYHCAAKMGLPEFLGGALFLRDLTDIWARLRI